jgi:SHS2 domain-containing protein
MYEWADHTAEVELHLEADSEETIFRDAVRAYAELVGADCVPTERRSVVVTAHDRATLLAQWLEELIYFGDDGFSATGVSKLEVRPNRVVGVLEGCAAHARPLVKAVTYHRLEFGRKGGRWNARVVLDV